LKINRREKYKLVSWKKGGNVLRDNCFIENGRVTLKKLKNALVFLEGAK